MTGLDNYSHILSSTGAQAEVPNHKNSFHTYDAIQKLPAMDEELARLKPWKTDPHFFKTVQISTLALVKMAIHAQGGGLMEVMGMIKGKIARGVMIATDVYALPVEGTETRVNAQAEGYEYMVEYMQMSKMVKDDNIVGWYHSHPGYGCWLSGIDVSTQALNQNFQDPYLALVIDPVQTAKQKKVEIGAFRTLPDGCHESFKTPKSHNKSLPHGKRTDYGAHCDKYYKLDIEIFHSPLDSQILSASLKTENQANASWIMNLLDNSVNHSNAIQTETDVNELRARVPSKHGQRVSLLDKYEIRDESLEEIHSLVNILKKHEPQQPPTQAFSQSVLRNYNVTFEEMISSRMLRECDKNEVASSRADLDTDMDKESDAGNCSEAKPISLDISDRDDQQSIDSASLQMDTDDAINSRPSLKESCTSGIKDGTLETLLVTDISVDRGEKRPRSPWTSDAGFPRTKYAIEESCNVSRTRGGGTSGRFFQGQMLEDNIDRTQLYGQSQESMLLPSGQEERRRERKSNTPLAQATRLAKIIGQRALQNMITLDAQAHLFASCRLSENPEVYDPRDS